MDSASVTAVPVQLPEFVSCFVRPSDEAQPLPGEGTAIVIRPAQRTGRYRELLHPRIGCVFRSKLYADSPDRFPMAVIEGSTELRSLILSTDESTRNFYAGTAEGGQVALQSSIRVSENRWVGRTSARMAY